MEVRESGQGEQGKGAGKGPDTFQIRRSRTSSWAPSFPSTCLRSPSEGSTRKHGPTSRHRTTSTRFSINSSPRAHQTRPAIEPKTTTAERVIGGREDAHGPPPNLVCSGPAWRSLQTEAKTGNGSTGDLTLSKPPQRWKVAKTPLDKGGNQLSLRLCSNTPRTAATNSVLSDGPGRHYAFLRRYFWRIYRFWRSSRLSFRVFTSSGVITRVFCTVLMPLRYNA